jgi:hypothetical protein
MVKPARVLAETRRELLRPSSLWAAAGFLSFCFLAALFSITQTSLKLYTPAVYLLCPLLMTAVGAHRIARDRDRDAAALNATTPLRPSEAVLGKALSLTLLWTLTLAATAPLLYVLVSQAATGAFLQLAPLLAWGLVLGLVGILAGLIVGHSQDGETSRAVASAFGLVLAWIVLALQRDRFYALASDDAQLTIVRGFVHLSPLTWAIEALSPDAAFLRVDHLGLLLGLALLVLPLGLGLASLAVGLQQLHDWRPNLAERPQPLAALATAVAAMAVLLGTWSYPPPAPTQPSVGPDASQGQVGDTQVRFILEDETPWSKKTFAKAHLTFHGQPNTTLGLDRFTLEAEHLRLELRSEAPDHVNFDEAGRASVEIPLRLIPQRLVTHTTARANFTLDGQPASLEAPLSPRGIAIPAGASVLTGLASLGGTATAAMIIPRRLNRW